MPSFSHLCSRIRSPPVKPLALAFPSGLVSNLIRGLTQDAAMSGCLLNTTANLVRCGIAPQARRINMTSTFRVRVATT